MELRVIAVGRMTDSAQKSLYEDYFERAERLSRDYGCKNLSLLEIDERKYKTSLAQNKAIEAQLANEPYWALDERGKALTSRNFSHNLQKIREDNPQRWNIIIGGADGLSENLRKNATMKISFGSMVWPHMLVRIMLMEQIYRGYSILAGLPYHRD